MRKAIFVLFLIAMIEAFASAAPSIEVHGHRGARARRPENTLPAFDYALAAGVDVLEMDLAVTQDGVLVISHDPHISPELCLDEKGNKPREGLLIHSLTLAEVKKFDCGAIKNPRFPNQVPVPGTRIPTLDEVFNLVKKSSHPAAKKVKFNIETKITEENPDFTVGHKEFAKLLHESLRKHHMIDRTIVQSFDYRTLVDIRKLEPRIVISALSEKPTEDLVQSVKALKANFSSPYWRMLSKDVVQRLHQAGAKAAPWTVDEPADWQAMIDMGADAIITDDPEELIKFLKSKKLR